MYRVFLISLIVLSISKVIFAQPEFFARIRALKSEGKSGQALQLVEEQIEKIKDANEFRLLNFERGLLLFESAKYDEAILLFKELSNSQHNLIEYAFFFLAKAYLNKGDLLEATKNFNYVLTLSPNIKMQNEVNFSLARIFNESKKLKEARKLLQKLEKKTRREESYADVLYEFAKTERGLGNQAQFCKWTRKLFTHFPEYARVAKWGLVHMQNEFEGQATGCSISTEEKRIRIKNLQWANLANKAKEEIEVLKLAKEASPLEIEKLEVSYLLHEGEAKEVMKLLKAKYELRKRDPKFLIMLASAAAKAGENQAAVGSYYQAYKISPKGKVGRQALYQSAFMSYQFQDYDGAARKFQEFLKVHASSGLSRDARWHLAWIRYLRGDYDGAYNAFVDLKSLVRKSRKNAKAFPLDRLNYWIGMSLYRLGRYAEARLIFESLAADRLLGFYAITAQGRLKKIDENLPKQPKRVLPDENMNLSRFTGLNALLPADDPNWFREVAQLKNVEIEGEVQIIPNNSEEAENEQELLAEATTSDRGIEISEGEKETERVTSFKNPVLVKRFERARELMILGLNDWAKWDLYDIERKTSNKEYLKTLMQEYEYVENYQRSSYIGQINFATQRSLYGIEGMKYLWEHTYPRAYSIFVGRYSKELSVPAELIWAIMRAESQYKKDVVSPVGALGLMQVMPLTASRMARAYGENEFSVKSLLTPEPAIKIGAKYLQRLMKKFDGNIALVAASYNAGPHRAKSWIASFGQLDLDEFIEHIPYLETRNYVKKVLANFNVYSRLYNGKKEYLLSTSDALKVRFTDPVPLKETWEDI